MHIVCLAATKGGVGKTTLTVHWAVEATRYLKHVAIVDMDIQESSVRWYQRRRADFPTVFRADASSLPIVLDACHTEKVDLVLIDTEPRVAQSSFLAAQKADLVVVPCGISALDIEAVGGSIDIAQSVQTPCCVVITRGRHSSFINDQAFAVLQQYEVPVCPVYVMRRALLEDACIDGRTAGEIAPRSKAAHEITASWRWVYQQLLHRYNHA